MVHPHHHPYHHPYHHHRLYLQHPTTIGTIPDTTITNTRLWPIRNISGNISTTLVNNRLYNITTITLIATAFTPFVPSTPHRHHHRSYQHQSSPHHPYHHRSYLHNPNTIPFILATTLTNISLHTTIYETDNSSKMLMVAGYTPPPTLNIYHYCQMHHYFHRQPLLPPTTPRQHNQH